VSGLRVEGVVAIGDGGARAGPFELELEPGQSWALVGPAGSGKSLLMSALVGLADVSAGRVHIGGDALDREAPAAARRHVGFCFQRDALLADETVLANVLVGVRARGLVDEAEARARAALEDVGLSAAADRFVRELSGGMRRRLGLARALACDPDVLLCDDVTAGLDPLTAGEVLDRLLAPVRAGRACALLTAHDVDAVLPRTDGVTVLDEGAVAYHGPVADLASHERLSAFAPRARA
jgi:ABC-type multidrug transport system ATPase subunit